MYGLVNSAIEEAILEKYGQEFWEYIKRSCESMGDSDGAFISRLYYDDELTYRLIDAAERILNSEKYGHVSQLFGEKFFQLVQEAGYESILSLLGSNLKDFLENLDCLHAHLGTTYSRMKPPSFRCTHRLESGVRVPDKLVLHYYSERIGLEGFMIGMVKAAARQLFSLKVDVQIDKLKLLDQDIDHTEFLISVVSVINNENRMETGENEFSRLYEDESFTYKNVRQLANAAHTNKISPLVFAQVLPFHLIFDRNLVVQQAGTSISRVVPELNVNKNVRLTDVMKMLEPNCLKGKLNFDNILKYPNAVYVFRPDEQQVISGGHRHLRTDCLKNLPLSDNPDKILREVNQLNIGREHHNNGNQLSKISDATNQQIQLPAKSRQLSEDTINKYIVKLTGQMIYIHDRDLMLFVCSPSVANLDDLNNTGLFLSDIPLHDATRDLVLLSEQFEAEYKVQQNLKMLTEKLDAIKFELEEEKKKTDQLLYSVLPPLVANELRNNRPVPAKRFQPVTILFSGIVGFSDFCARNSDSSGAIRIVNLLNKIYTTFDVLTEPKRNPYVYKVETVGDKYMAVSGLPESCESHCRHINRLALDIQDLAKTIKLEEYTGTRPRPELEQQEISQEPGKVGKETESSQMDQFDHLRVTIGIHCGEVVTGVIGKRTPRYCLFGNTVNLTSRCETTGKKGAINVSQDVYSLCTKDPNNFDSEFEFQYRGQVNMKGKSEPMGMWYLSRRRLQ